MTLTKEQIEQFPNCTRCGHSLEDHDRPGEKGLPWPCAKCECPGFVVARDLHEDIRHTTKLRIADAIADVYPERMTAEQIHEHVDQVLRELDHLIASQSPSKEQKN